MSSGRVRDYILFYVNGREHRVTGQAAFLQLSDYLRSELGLCGTKVVCAEGDCGACTVLVGKLDGSKAHAENGKLAGDGKLAYKPLNSCIQAMYQLDCSHIVTIEGLTPENELSPIQQSMVDCHGAQCGFCTPGFVVSLAAMFENASPVASTRTGSAPTLTLTPTPICSTPTDSTPGDSLHANGKALTPCSVTRTSIKDALTGNLCRCTGYESIIKSAMQCDAAAVVPVEVAYPSEPIAAVFAQHASSEVCIECERGTIYIPHDLKSAVQFRRANEVSTIISGGTDVCVNINKRGLRPRTVISICNLPGLNDLTIEHGNLIIGARVTLEQLAQFTIDSVPELSRMLWIFGAPQIRHAGTMAGNIANGSPIGDTLPFLFVMEAEVEVHGVQGSRRVPICSFYTGYKQMDMAPDELITRIIVPLPQSDERLRLFKVSRREHLDISSLGAAFLVATESGGEGSLPRIEYARVALGGVGPTAVRLPRSELYLRGKEFSFETFEQAGVIAVSEISPISDVRGSSDFRNQLAENIFLKFFCSFEDAEDPSASLCSV